MDKNTLSNYGWIVIAVLVLAVMIALATPFGKYVESGVRSTTAGLFETSEKALNVVGMSAGDGNFEDGYTGGQSAPKCCETPNIKTYGDDTKCEGCGKVVYGEDMHNGIIPEGATYTTGLEYCDICSYDFKIMKCWCGKYDINSNVENCEICDFSFTNGTCSCGNYNVSHYEPIVVYNAKDVFPNNSSKVSKYEYGDYIYECKNSEGWSSSVKDKTKNTYGEILDNINGRDVLNCYFGDCQNLSKVPVLPKTIKEINFNLLPENIKQVKFAGTKQDCFKIIETRQTDINIYNINYNDSYTIKCSDGEIGLLFTTNCNSGCHTTGTSFIYGDYIDSCTCGYTNLPHLQQWVEKN